MLLAQNNEAKRLESSMYKKGEEEKRLFKLKALGDLKE